MTKCKHDQQQEPGDDAFIVAASRVQEAAGALAAAASAPLYDPHTMFRVLNRLTPVAAAMAKTADALLVKVGNAGDAGLLVSDQPDLVDVDEAAYEAREGLRDALAAAKALKAALTTAEIATAGFAPRAAVAVGED